MKRLLIVLVTVLFTIVMFGQAPQKMSYQAVVRNASGVLVQSSSVGMRISVLQGSVSGTAVYTETQTPTTNTNGLVTVEIGGGTPITGTFEGIDWSSGPYFIKTETAPTGGTDYTITGIAQLLSVPYSLHAKTAETVTGTITETDPVYSGSQAANITANDITKLNNLSGTNTGDQDLSILASTAALTTGLADKVDKVTDKGLSTNDYTTVEQTKLAGIATGAEVNVNADWNAATGDAQVLNKPTIPAAADGSETKVTAGTNMSVTGAGTTTSPYVVNATGAATLAIGQTYQGGIIFWLDATGLHGLIAATTDQSIGIQWYNGTFRFTGSGDGLYAGALNTAIIVATQMADNQTGSFAARVCANYSVISGGVTYGDWYLPSKYELNLLYTQKNMVGGFASANYWSSTESSEYFAWVQNLNIFYQVDTNKGTTFHVRAVRAF